MISAPRNDENGRDAGKVYLFFGSLGRLAVLKPNGGENWEIGSQYTIEWYSSNPQGQVKIEFSTNGGSTWQVIKDSEDDDGACYWQISNSVPPSTNCLVKITHLMNGAWDVSDAPFTLSKPTLAINIPNGGENWPAGETHNITWSYSGNIQNVKIEYS